MVTVNFKNKGTEFGSFRLYMTVWGGQAEVTGHGFNYHPGRDLSDPKIENHTTYNVPYIVQKFNKALRLIRKAVP